MTPFKHLFLPFKLIGFLVLVVGLTTATMAQAPKIDTGSPLAGLQLKKWSEVENTSLDKIFDLAQDPSGYLWIASQRGLLRFNGSQLLKFDLSNTPLEILTIRHVEVTQSGVVWLASEGGIYRLENGQMEEVLDSEGQSPTMISTFILDKNDHLWASTFEQYIYKEKAGVLHRFEEDQYRANRLFRGQNDSLYAIKANVRGQIYSFNEQQGIVPIEIPGLPDVNIWAVNADTNGKLFWVDNFGSTWSWDGEESVQLSEATHTRFDGQDILLGADGDLWYGTETLVRVLANGESQTYSTANGLSPGKIGGILADRDGNIWIGTTFGLNRLSNTPFYSLVNDPNQDLTPYCMYPVPGTDQWLIGTKEDGLYLLQDGQLSPLEHPALKPTIHTLAFDKDGFLLLGQENGLFKFNYRNSKITWVDQLTDDPIVILHVSPQNEYLYISRIKGKEEFKVYKNGRITLHPSEAEIYLWMEDRSQQQVWVASRQGPFIWDGQELKRPLIEDNPFSTAYLTSHTRSIDDRIWMGSLGRGFIRVENNQLHHYTTRNGLPENKTTHLFQTDQNSIWFYLSDQRFGKVVRMIPSTTGLKSMISPAESYVLNQELAPFKDDLIGYPTQFEQPEDNRVVLLGSTGVFSFEPQRVRSAKPLVKVESVGAEDSIFDPSQPLRLRAGTRNIEFNYGAIDYDRGGFLQFEYLLEGYDTDWQQSGSRTTAYYSNLPAGEFHFKVRVRNPDGDFVYSDQIVQVTQEEFWYKEKWAFLLYFIGLIGLITLILQLRLRQIKQQRNTLKELVDQRTQELQDLNLNLEHQVEERTKELTDSEERYRYALDAANDGIFDWDIPSDSIKLSPAVYTMLGYAPYSFDENRQLVLDRVYEDDQSGMDRLEAELTKIMDTRFVQNEMRMVQKDGNLIWVRLKAKIFERDKRNNPIRVVGTLNDITSEKQKTKEMLDAVLKTEDLERSRISKDIHDGLQQTLTLAKMNFRGVTANLDQLPEEASEKFRTGFDFLEKSIAESRHVAHNLMPKAIMDFGVISAFMSLIEQMDKATEETEYHFYHNFKTSKLDNQQIEVTLYRILQESLNNIVKYAKASRVDVQLLEYDKLYVLTIEDNGIGFDTNEARKREGMGFTSMKNRLEAIDGFMEVSSQPGKGVSILVEINKQFA